MNANSVWKGHEYAYVPIVRRRYFPTNAVRVKVLDLREVQQYGKSRKDTFATVEFIDQNRPNREVNVRNLYDFWDSYQDERQAMVSKREREDAERQARWKAQQAEREAALAEQARVREENRQRLQRIANGLAATLSIDVSTIEVNTTYEKFTIEARHLQFLE